MPKNWKTYKLTDFIEINPKVSLKTGSVYSFVEMKDLDPNNKYVLPSTTKELKGGARFQNGDTLFARITPCLENGKICQVKGLQEESGFGSTEFLVFRGNENISDSDFIFYLSRTPEFRAFAEANMIGTSGRQRVAKEVFSNLELSLPPLPEQRAIASILSALDDKIELNLQMNRTLEEMAMALYKHWFVDFGPFKDGKFVESELGMIPEGWEVKRLGELIDISNGYAFKGSDFTETGIPVLKIKNVKPNKILFDSLSFVPKDATAKSEKARINYRDILITMTGNRMAGSMDSWVGKVAMFPRNGDYYLNQRVSKLVLTEENECFRDYLAIMMSSVELQYYFIKNSTSSGGQANISPAIIKAIRIITPPNEILSQFNQFIELNFELKSLLEKENQTLIDVRDHLLPKLISGEIEVKI